MIRFSASLVVIAMGLLVAGGVTSKLLLVYVAIALSVVALIFLIIGAILHRGEFRARPSGETAGTAAGGDAQDAETEAPALAGAASASGALAGRARAAGGGGATAKDTASAAGTGKPPWPDSPPPAGPDRWAAFERIADRHRPDVPWPGDWRDRPSAPAGPGGPSEPGGHGGGPEEQWPGKRLPDEIQLHAPWPAQDWSAGRGPAEPRPRQEGPADQRRPRERPSAGPETEAIPEPQPAASAGPETEALAGPRTEAIKPPLADAMKAPLADAIRELRAKASEKPRAGASRSPLPGAPAKPRAESPDNPAAAGPPENTDTAAAPTQQMAAARPAESRPAESRPAEPEPAEPGPGEPESAKPEPGERGSGEPVRAEAEPADQAVTVVPGVPRYHRSDCILIRFMGDNDLQKMPAEAAREAGCTPCRACQPDGEDAD